MKCVICIPHYGPVSFKFVRSLAALLLYSGKLRIVLDDGEIVPEIDVIDHSSSILPNVRNTLLQEALRRNATHLLWLDSDMVFPPDTLARLLGHGLPVVGVNYLSRNSGLAVAHRGEERVETSAAIAAAMPVEEVTIVGMGALLMRADVLLKLKKKPADEPENLWPLFAYDRGPNGEFMGEDCYFLTRLRAAGVPIHVDHRLSLEVGHANETVLTFPR